MAYKYCQKCGNANDANNKFCEACGANLSEKAQLSSAPAKKRKRMKKDDNLYVVLKV